MVLSVGFVTSSVVVSPLLALRGVVGVPEESTPRELKCMPGAVQALASNGNNTAMPNLARDENEEECIRLLPKVKVASAVCTTVVT